MPRLEIDRLKQAFMPRGQVRDFSALVVLELTEPVGQLESRTTTPRGTCQLIASRGDELTIDATLDDAGYLVVNERFAPEWRACRETSSARVPLDVLRANGIMRAVALPAGTHRVRFFYRPKSVILGSCVSAIGVLACVVITRRLAST